jgi:Cu/Ag efflux protein CusF
MGLPSKPVTLNAEQIEELNRRLSTMRHDVNNNLSLMLAALEVIRYKPQMAEKMLATLAEQPPKITTAIAQFSQDFEKIFGITR